MTRAHTATVGFDAFYRDTAHSVVHLVYAATGDLALAHDVTRETYARAWQQWASVRDHEEPLAWVRTMARRLASSWRVREIEARALRPAGLADHARSPDEARLAVVAALRTLDGSVRDVLVLHYVADLPVEQIAAETGLPAGTVKTRLHRGRRQLARALAVEETPHV